MDRLTARRSANGTPAEISRFRPRRNGKTRAGCSKHPSWHRSLIPSVAHAGVTMRVSRIGRKYETFPTSPWTGTGQQGIAPGRGRTGRSREVRALHPERGAERVNNRTTTTHTVAQKIQEGGQALAPSVPPHTFPRDLPCRNPLPANQRPPCSRSGSWWRPGRAPETRPARAICWFP